MGLCGSLCYLSNSAVIGDEVKVEFVLFSMRLMVEQRDRGDGQESPGDRDYF